MFATKSQGALRTPSSRWQPFGPAWLQAMWLALLAIFWYEILIVDIPILLKNIDNDKDNLENIDKAILENIDIDKGRGQILLLENIDINKEFENIDISIDSNKDNLKNIDININIDINMVFLENSDMDFLEKLLEKWDIMILVSIIS